MQNRSETQKALVRSRDGRAVREERNSPFPDRVRMIFTFSLFIAALLLLSCAGTVARTPGKETVREYYFFDGISLKRTSPVQGRISVAEGVTAGNYGVLFFTREGFYPEAEVFKATEHPYETEVKALKRLADPRKGVLIGVVYKPVSGGKIRPRRGIVTLHKSEVVQIAGGNRTYAVMTDERGVYRIQLPAGEYAVSAGLGEPSEVVVERSKTVIHTIQKGIMLVD